eukprot:g5642.t1
MMASVFLPLSCSTSSSHGGFFDVGSVVRVKDPHHEGLTLRATVMCVDEDDGTYDVAALMPPSRAYDDTGIGGAGAGSVTGGDAAGTEDDDFVVPATDVTALELFETCEVSGRDRLDGALLKAQGTTLFKLGDVDAATERWLAALEATAGLDANPLSPMASVIVRAAASPAAAGYHVLRGATVSIVDLDAETVDLMYDSGSSSSSNSSNSRRSEEMGGDGQQQQEEEEEEEEDEVPIASRVVATLPPVPSNRDGWTVLTSVLLNLTRASLKSPHLRGGLEAGLRHATLCIAVARHTVANAAADATSAAAAAVGDEQRAADGEGAS